jgi:hypothetical protein
MRRLALLIVFVIANFADANPPVASYIFPAGAQRGTKVNVKVGGLFLHQKCGFEMLGPGVTAPAFLTRTKMTWFEGPLLPLPDSQRQEDYPKDMAGQLAIAADAPLGLRTWRVWTSQGATPSLKFVVGDLPEIVEDEIDGDPLPVPVTFPLTINGRIFPREDVDIYAIRAKKGEAIRCEVNAARIGSPLDARLEVRDANGRRIAEADANGSDSALSFTAPADGDYFVRIDDVRAQGGQAFVYRLTIIAAPFVERVFPLGGKRSSTFDVEVTGQAIPAKTSIAIPKEAPTSFLHSFSVRSKPCNPIALDIDDHLEFIAPRDLAKTITPPAILNGRIEKPGQIDEWKWQAKKGEMWEFELRAARLGSRLDGVVTICDSQGKPLTKAEATAADCTARFAAPADSVYVVKVQDRFQSRGGPEYAYRLRIVPPPRPGFRLTLATDAVTLPRKGTAKLKLNVERINGFKEPITLEVKGLPAHVTFSPAVVAANQAAVDLTFKAEEQAKIDVSRLIVEGSPRKADSARGASGPLLLAVALPTPFVIKGEYDMGFAPRGAVHKRKYKIERNGYDGPLEISLADRQARHLQGVEGPTITVPAGVSEFTYAAYLPPWMEMGRTCRVCVQGVGVVKDADGSEHRVSFSSVNQNEQLVAVVGPGVIALEAERTSFRAEPGKQFAIAVKVQRGQGVEGPVELELVTPSHQRGLTAAKTTLAAKEDRGQLIVTCADKLTGPFNMPVIMRATLMRSGEPIVAEVKLDVQP